VSKGGLAIYIKKFKAKEEELWKLKYFTMQKNILSFKKSSEKKKPKSFKIYYNSITNNLNFQHKPKYHHLSKILI
jgi:hypothetical protein